MTLTWCIIPSSNRAALSTVSFRGVLYWLLRWLLNTQKLLCLYTPSWWQLWVCLSSTYTCVHWRQSLLAQNPSRNSAGCIFNFANPCAWGGHTGKGDEQVVVGATPLMQQRNNLEGQNNLFWSSNFGGIYFLCVSTKARLNTFDFENVIFVAWLLSPF